LPLSPEALALRLIPDVQDGSFETLFNGRVPA
jgi:acyl-CoA dehydrogenase